MAREGLFDDTGYDFGPTEAEERAWNEGYEQGKADAISEVEQKIYELQLKYENQYGCTITEMYVEVVHDLLEWLRNQRGE